jgi:predicted RNA-binding Zn-ribbon protein involved in translation (DUF1610 family)
VSNQFCPECGAVTHRSRSRNFGERVVKVCSAYRTFRCGECGWRGWLRHSGKQKASATGPKARTIVTVIVALLVTVFLAIYLVQRFNDLTNP